MARQVIEMNELISKLTGEQALQTLERLARKNARMAEAIATEAERVLAAVDVDEVAEDVFGTLDGIDVEDCWGRAGSHRGGYTSPGDAAAELIEETLQPFADQANRYDELGMPEQERDACMGIVLGLYRYEKESKSEFKDWCTDMPIESAGWVLDQWRARNRDGASRAAMAAFIRERCAEWAKYLVRK